MAKKSRSCKRCAAALEPHSGRRLCPVCYAAYKREKYAEAHPNVKRHAVKDSARERRVKLLCLRASARLPLFC